MLFVLVAFFQTLGLTIITEPLNRLLSRLFEFAPNLLGAGVLLVVAWFVASALRFIVSKALGATRLDDTLSSQAGLSEDRQVPMSETLANVVYWFIFLLFLPAILSALGMAGLLAPVQGMVDNLLRFLPNVLGAAVIGVVGWFVARIIRQVVTGLLKAAGADRLGERVGLRGAVPIVLATIRVFRSGRYAEVRSTYTHSSTALRTANCESQYVQFAAWRRASGASRASSCRSSSTRPPRRCSSSTTRSAFRKPSSAPRSASPRAS